MACWWVSRWPNPRHFPQNSPRISARGMVFIFRINISSHLLRKKTDSTPRGHLICTPHLAGVSLSTSAFQQQQPAAVPEKMAPAAGGLRSLFVGETIRFHFNRQHSLFLPKCARHICNCEAAPKAPKQQIGRAASASVS